MSPSYLNIIWRICIFYPRYKGGGGATLPREGGESVLLYVSAFCDFSFSILFCGSVKFMWSWTPFSMANRRITGKTATVKHTEYYQLFGLFSGKRSLSLSFSSWGIQKPSLLLLMKILWKGNKGKKRTNIERSTNTIPLRERGVRMQAIQTKSKHRHNLTLLI